MVGEDEAVGAGAQTYQGEPHQGRPRRVEAAHAVCGECALQFGVALVLGQPGQVQFVPRQLYGAGHDLHGPALAALLTEAGTQVGVAHEKGLGGGPHALAVQGSVDVEPELHHVDVVAAAVVVPGEEEQSLLERGEREYVFDSGPGHCVASSSSPSSLSSRSMSV